MNGVGFIQTIGHALMNLNKEPQTESAAGQSRRPGIVKQAVGYSSP